MLGNIKKNLGTGLLDKKGAFYEFMVTGKSLSQSRGNCRMGSRLLPKGRESV